MMWILYLAILFGIIAIVLRLIARHLRNKAASYQCEWEQPMPSTDAGKPDKFVPFVEDYDDDLGAW